MQKCVGRWIVGTLALAGMLLVAAPVAANIIFTLGNNPQPQEENVLFNAGTISGPATTVTGVSATSHCIVSFTGTEDLLTPSSGQARVTAVDGGFTSLAIGLGCTATDIIFALNPSTPGGSGTATVDVAGNMFSFGFGPGESFLTITATGGDTITGLSLTSDADIGDIRQVRISGSSLLPAPEPGTLALLGIVAFALAAVRRRRT